MELPDRDEYEATVEKRIGRLAKRHRKELLAHMGRPPDMANVPAAFWEEVRDEMEAEMAVALLLIFLASATFHGAPEKASEAFARTWAGGHARTSADLWAQTALQRAGILGRDMRQMEKSPTLKWVNERLESIFGETRVHSLAVNETTIAQTEGGEYGMRETAGISPDDKWRTNPQLSRTGPCPICAPLNGTRRPVWSRQFPSGPPAHPMCVCDIIYVNLSPTDQKRIKRR